MGRIVAVITVIVGILFALCVMSGACGYHVYGDVTDHGHKVVGFDHEAGFQGHLGEVPSPNP